MGRANVQIFFSGKVICFLKEIPEQNSADMPEGLLFPIFSCLPSAYGMFFRCYLYPFFEKND
ncbi:MAG: hypothetical protein DYG98_09930 [Haliscomenobacteraceae bacterium CHB4]|nr:hypothetical protein [Haliscomenobacteraceae bacterium CHB4]